MMQFQMLAEEQLWVGPGCAHRMALWSWSRGRRSSETGAVAHCSEWLSLKNLHTIDTGESVEEREPSYTLGGNVSCCSHCVEQYGGSSKN